MDQKKKNIAVIYVEEFPAYVFLWEFLVSEHVFRSLLHFGFDFVHDARECFNFILSHAAV